MLTYSTRICLHMSNTKTYLSKMYIFDPLCVYGFQKTIFLKEKFVPIMSIFPHHFFTYPASTALGRGGGGLCIGVGFTDCLYSYSIFPLVRRHNLQTVRRILSWRLYFNWHRKNTETYSKQRCLLATNSFVYVLLMQVMSFFHTYMCL
jgi:hypothetical protein